MCHDERFCPQEKQDAELLGAIARGWCSKENEHKEMDADLVTAIAKEVAPIIASAKEDGRMEERQFILNILDGVDIADEQSGNKGGGTKAIRHALQSRIIN